MFQRFHAMREEREGGFTLIELLVVILIIAILAAIAIPVFLRQREKGWRGQLQSALKNAATAVESFGTENNGNFTPMAGASCTERACNTRAALASGVLPNLQDQGFSGSAGTVVTVQWATQREYCIQGTHLSLPPAEIWRYSSAAGEPERGACPAAPAP